MAVIVDKADGAVALAIIRSLGKKGINVTAASSVFPAISFYSKYCKDFFIYTSPEKDKIKYLKDLLSVIKKRNYICFK